MNTDQIEQIIASHFADPHASVDLQELLTVVAEREGVQPEMSAVVQGAKFVYNYIEQVPYLLTVAWTSAKAVGLEKEFESVLDMVISYWVEGDDVIPDSMGIVGVLDDAYCSLLSLQTVSDFYQLQTGKYLFPDDLTSANDIMRKIIGEPYATELDNIVNKAMLVAHMKQAVKMLASPEKQRLFEKHANIWNHEPVNEVPIAQMAELGLIKLD
jgi:uncharacterized membrane protein YkvA (DUF1232 family)